MYVDISFCSLIQVMVATVRCEEIGNEKLASFTADEVIIDLTAYYALIHATEIGYSDPKFLYMLRNGNKLKRLFNMAMYLGLGKNSAAFLTDVYLSEFFSIYE